MLVNFRCQQCRGPLSIQADRKGTSILCPECHCEMVVPAASEPNLSHGRPVQETFALQGEAATGESNSQATHSEVDIRALALRDLIPSGIVPEAKSRKRPMDGREPALAEPHSWRRSDKSLVFAACMLLVIVAGASAYFWRTGAEPTASPALVSSPSAAQIEKPPSPVTQPSPPPGFDLPDGQTLAVILNHALTTPSALRGSAETGTERQLTIVPEPPTVLAKPANPKPAPTTTVFKRRQNLSEDDLKRELRWAKEIPPMTSATISQLMNAHMERFRSFGDIDFEPRVLLGVRPDLRTLPVRHGSPIKLDPRSAEALEVFSRKLHHLVDNTVPRKEDGEHVKPERLRDKLTQKPTDGRPWAWTRAEAVPALRQILMGEDKPLRWLLVELLAENSSPMASAALAQRAVFELSADLRQRAVEALRGRPPQDFRHILLYGLRYPWAPAADHAAEALVALSDREAVPSLITYLKKPDPHQPFQTSQNHTLVREVVRIHHQTNCVMCHSPAVSGWKDPVAKEVPGVFLTGTIEGGGGGYHPTQFPKQVASPLLVRADIVFLRQDFSVPVSVASAAAPMVPDQRFDFLVRTRPIKPQEMSEFKTAMKTSSYPQREAILWALRELTGKDAGNMTEEWVRLFPRAELDVERARLGAQLIQNRGVKQVQLLAKFKDREGEAYTLALAEAIPQIKGKNQEQARQALAERLSRWDVPVLRDRLRDDDREIRRAAAKACALKASDELVPDLFDLLEDSDPEVIEAAKSALQRLTGKDVAASN